MTSLRVSQRLAIMRRRNPNATGLVADIDVAAALIAGALDSELARDHPTTWVPPGRQQVARRRAMAALGRP